MKNLKTIITLMLSTLALMSCKDEKKVQADEAIDNYNTYVDSMSQVSSSELAENWSNYETELSKRKQAAEKTLEYVTDRAEYDKRIEETNNKYNIFIENNVVEQKRLAAKIARNKIVSPLFGGRDIGDDTSFNWVNKDNILKTFETFVNTASDNKSNYSREEWDDIKMLWEALNTRKNTVEKEGLTSSDNMKIAGFKTRFGVFFKLNRMTAKSVENAEANE